MNGQAKYVNYKSSDVEWIGEFPEHWITTRLGYHIHFITGFAFKSENFSFDSGVKLVRGDNVTEGSLRWGKRTRFWTTVTDNIQKYLLEANDILIGMDGSKVGKNFAMVQEADLPLLLVQRVARLRTRNSIVAKYLQYLIGSELFRTWTTLVKTDPAIPHISPDNIKDFPLVLPSIEEQIQIAKFLDYETAKIDALIEKQEQLIALLKEKRQAVISHAVTKGLNPAAPMRDSGIEWLGQVPAHWTVSAPKYFTAKIIDGPHHTPNYVDEGVPFVTVKNLTAGEWISLDDTKRITHADHQALIKRAHPQVGDILITKDGTLGVTRVIETHEEFSIFVSVALVKLRRHLADPWFVRFAFESSSAWAQFSVMSAGAALKHIVLSTIANVKIPLPPLREQQEIGLAVRKQCNQIDGLIDASNQRVELLQERRTALISAAVTGKIDVRGWQPPAAPSQIGPISKIGPISPNEAA